MGIEEKIPFGRANAIQRSSLATACGMSDRKMRNQIEAARRCGHIIINAQDSAGYYRIDPKSLSKSELAEINRQYRQNQHRALSVLSYQKHLRKILKENGIDT